MNQQYNIYITILSKKLKFSVTASSAAEAKKVALSMVNIDKIEPVHQKKDIDWSNPTSWFT